MAVQLNRFAGSVAAMKPGYVHSAAARAISSPAPPARWP